MSPYLVVTNVLQSDADVVDKLKQLHTLCTTGPDAGFCLEAVLSSAIIDANRLKDYYALSVPAHPLMQPLRESMRVRGGLV